MLTVDRKTVVTGFLFHIQLQQFICTAWFPSHAWVTSVFPIPKQKLPWWSKAMKQNLHLHYIWARRVYKALQPQ